MTIIESIIDGLEDHNWDDAIILKDISPDGRAICSSCLRRRACNIWQSGRWREAGITGCPDYVGPLWSRNRGRT